VISFFLVFVLINTIALACDLIDDRGQKIVLSKPAKRVISLSPDLTEMIFTIGGEKQLVGVVSHSDYPDAAKKLPIIANFNYLNIEAIVQLHPDLVIAWQPEHFNLLKKLGVPVYYANPKTLLDIPRTMRALGCLLGQEKNAKKASDIFLKKYSELKQKYAKNPPKTVFFQIWSYPLMTISNKSWINDALKICGGKNIFADLPGVAPIVNIEAVIAQNPDVILGTTDHQWQQKWQSWPELTAVKNNALFSIDPDLIERASPRILLGIQGICRDLQFSDKG